MPPTTLFQNLEYARPIDIENFNRLFDNYGPSIYGVIVTAVTDVALAEKLTAQAFVRICNNRDSYDASRQRIFIWMLSIVIQLLKEHGYSYRRPE